MADCISISGRIIDINWTNKQCKKEVGEHLKQIGIILSENIHPCLNEPTIIFFSKTNTELYDCLKTESNYYQSFVIAVAESSDALANSAHWQILEYGVEDILISKKDVAENIAAQIAARIFRWKEVLETLQLSVVRDNMIGKSRCWQKILRRTVETARFTDSSVLLMGESGTGKELFARLIHTLDTRKNKGDLVILDCSTIVPDLSGSEFFGHEKGAFTGAVEARDGAFALADGGTLFLDEVGELPLPLQAQLLRVVQERTYKRVGGNRWKQTDFRLVCATNRNLVEEVAKGSFRNDLYYRIALCTFHLPPLRKRLEDILPLTCHFLAAMSENYHVPEIDEAVEDYLLKRQYTGNVRELKQLVARIKYRHVGEGPITVGAIPEEDRPQGETLEVEWQNHHFEESIRRAVHLGASLKDIGQAAAEAAVRIAIDNEDGNLKRAAEKLGVTARALQLRRANQQA